MMNNGSILYLPIQINGGQSVPSNLLDRELFIKNGELYVGTGEGDPQMVIGRVVSGAEINNPTLSGNIMLGEGVLLNGKAGGNLYFVDDGPFPLDDSLNDEDKDALMNAVRDLPNLKERVTNLEINGGGSGSTTTNVIHDAELEDAT